MRCQYCDKRLGITKLLKGDTFCSLDHQELYLNAQAEAAYERLVESAEYSSIKKLKSVLSEEKPEPEQANSAEVPQAEPQVETAAQENEPTAALEIASLADAVERTAASELRSAPFLPDLPAVAVQPASRRPAAELTSATVQLPVSSTQQAPALTSSVLVVDASPVQPSVEVTPAASQPTWPSVPQGYPPVIVSSSATLVLDPSGADLIPLSVGKPSPGERPARLPQTLAIASPPRHPQLPSWQPERNLNPEASVLLANPPQGVACEIPWLPRLGSGYALPPLESFLSSQAEMIRIIPSAGLESSGSLPSWSMPSSSFFAVGPEMVAPPAALRAAPAAHLPASLIPRHELGSRKAPSTSDAFLFTIAPSQLGADYTTPLRDDPPAQIRSAWQETAIDSRIPSVSTAPKPAPPGLDVAAEAIPLEPSIAAAPPAPVETTAAVTSTGSFLLLSNPLALAEPGMPVSSAARQLRPEPSELQAPGGEEQDVPGLANLHPSLPSPWSLVTWSQSLSISIPARKRSDLSRPAQIALSARPGNVDVLPPSSPSRRGQRLTPLKPQPNEVVWMPAAPVVASLRPSTIEPISPGNEGTAPPTLVTVRIQAASMPVRPRAFSPFGAERGIGPVALRPSSDALTLACIDMAHGISNSTCGLRSEPGTALPTLSFERHAFSIALAPSSQGIEWGPIPGDQSGSTVQPFSAVKRSAGATTAFLPRPLASQSACPKVLHDLY
jgi:hypothetical protein